MILSANLTSIKQGQPGIKKDPKFRSISHFDRRIEITGISTIQFLACWFSVALFNNLSSISCETGTRQYRNCAHMLDDVTCPVFYMKTLFCPVNKIISSVSSLGFTLGIFIFKFAIKAI